MPDWNPPPDVGFDHVAAAELLGAAGAVEAGIAEALDRTRRDLDTATRTWSGNARRVVDDRLDRWWRTLAGLRDDLIDLAQRVGEAAAWASDEQVRRRAQQQRWSAEHAAEGAAASAALSAADAEESPR